MSKHESAPEEIKAKFREALERKEAHGGADVPADGGHGKVDEAHGPQTSATQQMFRRKSGS